MLRVAVVGRANDRARHGEGPYELREGLQHQLRHHGEDDRRPEAQRRTAQPAELRDPRSQVVAGERQVAGLLGDVDAHDPLVERPRAQGNQQKIDSL
jgi:hypothetical protein